jgi:hypothetical protein
MDQSRKACSKTRTRRWVLLPLLFVGAAAWGADGTDQTSFDQLVQTAGATQGAARACGAVADDLVQQRDTARRNLEKFAKEFHFSAAGYDTVFAAGEQEGEHMMADMKATGVDGCAGVMISLQHERNISYKDMKAATAEVTDGLPDEKK